MGEHHFNPRAQAARNGTPVRVIEQFEPNLTCAVVPREKTVVVPREQYVEQDGKRFVVAGGGELRPLPDDAVVLFDGEPLEGNEDKFDLAVVVGAIFSDPRGASLTLDGKPRRVGLGLSIVGRVPLDEFERRAREVLAGGQPADFIDRANWYQEIVRAATEVRNGS
jgi:hypothetical protein